ncbi:MAG: ABC transporter ATP-binding protein [Syntrophomonadaceae bacterium]|nr:ABC transporter ATP-binding protein [Syntrophomonadaceae bacterium]
MNILEMTKISEEFGGLRAVDNVSLSVLPREILGIIGPNGAGKTTLFNIITGIYVPTEGQLLFKERRIDGLAPHDIARLGIARTFQNIRLFGKLSVLDNVRVGRYGVTRSGFWSGLLRLPGGRREEKETELRAIELLELVGLADKRHEYAQYLAYGEQRRLEIVRALALDPSLLLLDEPGAGMNAGEKEELMAFVRSIRDQLELTIILVEHDMNLVMNICERIAVLNYGRKIAEGTPAQVKNDEQVIQSYLGAGV